jgi:multidrug efflux pump subunit AcrA (membrane-fusion protein)
MTLKSRLKLLAGLIGVFVLVGLLTLVFNQRQGQVASVAGSIVSEQFQIGSDYGGIVLERLVDEGDEVAEGEALLRVQSPSLQADLAEGLIQPSTIAYQVESGGIITLAAPVDGFVSDLATERGSFVQAGQVLAKVDRIGSLSVTAEFLLTAGDYARVEADAPVRIVLPNKTIIDGSVQGIEVQLVDGQAETTVTIISDDLVEGSHSGLARAGTPVSATVELRDDGIFAGLSDDLFNFLRTIGL